MRGRSVDAALIIGLVLVAGAIVWTLFSLGRSPERPPPDAGPSADGPAVPGDGDADGAGEDGANGGVVPVAPDGGGPQAVAPDGDGADGADGDAGGGDASQDGAGDASDDADDSPDANDEADDGADDGAAPGDALGRPDPTIPAEDAPAVPESGSVELGRVGFSFVTGGAGACGIELEAWTHVAVSRELLAAYGCGAEVTITLDDEIDGRTTVDVTVADTMNPSFSRTANLYVGEDEPALDFGLTSGTIEPR